MADEQCTRVCSVSVWPILVWLSLHRRKLLEARRTEDDYEAAKRSYDQVRKMFQTELDTWNREEYKQIQESRALLEKASAIISQKAYTLVGQAIEKTLRNCAIEGILSEVGERGRGPRGAFVDEQDVSVLGYYASARRTERVQHRVPWF